MVGQGSVELIGRKGRITEDHWNFFKGEFVIVDVREDVIKIEHENKIDSGYYSKDFIIKCLYDERSK